MIAEFCHKTKLSKGPCDPCLLPAYYILLVTSWGCSTQCGCFEHWNSFTAIYPFLDWLTIHQMSNSVPPCPAIVKDYHNFLSSTTHFLRAIDEKQQLHRWSSESPVFDSLSWLQSLWASRKSVSAIELVIAAAPRAAIHFIDHWLTKCGRMNRSVVSSSNKWDYTRLPVALRRATKFWEEMLKLWNTWMIWLIHLLEYR